MWSKQCNSTTSVAFTLHIHVFAFGCFVPMTTTTIHDAIDAVTCCCTDAMWMEVLSVFFIYSFRPGIVPDILFHSSKIHNFSAAFVFCLLPLAGSVSLQREISKRMSTAEKNIFFFFWIKCDVFYVINHNLCFFSFCYVVALLCYVCGVRQRYLVYEVLICVEAPIFLTIADKNMNNFRQHIRPIMMD